MYVRELSLRDFRSWADCAISLQPGISIFEGANGYGKTNIVEAIGYIAHLSSHRNAQDSALVRHGKKNARISLTAVQEGRELTAHLLIQERGRNQAQINRTRLAKPREILGVLRAVFFSPEDLALVRGEPADRRKYLDTILVSRQPRLAGVRADYDKVLKQRNGLLKTATQALRRGYGSDDGALLTLDTWDSQLAKLGAVIIQARLQLVAELQKVLPTRYSQIAPQSRPASARYDCSFSLELSDSQLPSVEEIEAMMLGALASNRTKEIERGLSLVGPHRDDVHFLLGGYLAKGFSSHGETWSMALALRLSEFEILKQNNSEPILVLDDVFAELDARRREHLVKAIQGVEQVLITAAVGDDLPENLNHAIADRFRVDITEAEDSADGVRSSHILSLKNRGEWAE